MKPIMIAVAFGLLITVTTTANAATYAPAFGQPVTAVATNDVQVANWLSRQLKKLYQCLRYGTGECDGFYF